MSFLSFVRLSAVLWAALIAVMSLIPGEHTPDTGVSDKFEHMAGYLILAFLISLGWLRLLPGFAGAFLFGICIELLQGASGYRTLDPMDALANGAGGAIGCILAIIPIRFQLRKAVSSKSSSVI